MNSASHPYFDLPERPLSEVEAELSIQAGKVFGDWGELALVGEVWGAGGSWTDAGTVRWAWGKSDGDDEGWMDRGEVGSAYWRLDGYDEGWMRMGEVTQMWRRLDGYGEGWTDMGADGNHMGMVGHGLRNV